MFLIALQLVLDPHLFHHFVGHQVTGVDRGELQEEKSVPLEDVVAEVGDVSTTGFVRIVVRGGIGPIDVRVDEAKARAEDGQREQPVEQGEHAGMEGGVGVFFIFV